MKTYQFMWRMMRYRPGLYLIDGIFWTLIHLSPLVPGLNAKSFFDSLDQATPGQFSVWWVVAWLVMTALARVLLTRMQSGKLIAREVLQELEAREVPLFKQHIRYLTRYEGFTTPEFLDEYRNVYREVRADL